MPLVKGIGKPDEGEPHVRIDGGALETGQPGRPSAGPRPVCWKMPPQWPGRDPACWILVPAPALYPTSLETPKLIRTKAGLQRNSAL